MLYCIMKKLIVWSIKVPSATKEAYRRKAFKEKLPPSSLARKILINYLKAENDKKKKYDVGPS